MNAPFFHGHGRRPLATPDWLAHLEAWLARTPEHIGWLWGAFKIFYGIGAITVVGSVALVAGLGVQMPYIDDQAADSVAAAAPVAATASIDNSWPLPDPANQVVYVVGSQRASDNLRAYGPSTDDPSKLLPNARITVFVADTPQREAEAHAAFDRMMAAHSAGSEISIRLVDLR